MSLFLPLASLILSFPSSLRTKMKGRTCEVHTVCAAQWPNVDLEEADKFSISHRGCALSFCNALTSREYIHPAERMRVDEARGTPCAVHPRPALAIKIKVAGPRRSRAKSRKTHFIVSICARHAQSILYESRGRRAKKHGFWLSLRLESSLQVRKWQKASSLGVSSAIDVEWSSYHERLFKCLV